MKNKYCKECQGKTFDNRGVAILRGLMLFTCLACGQSSGNFASGQTTLCHACSEKLGKCAICGKNID